MKLHHILKFIKVDLKDVNKEYFIILYIDVLPCRKILLYSEGKSNYKLYLLDLYL